jgi:hypothetical protein
VHRSPLDESTAGPAAPTALRVVLAAVLVEVVALVAAGGFAIVELARGIGAVGVNLFLAAFAWGIAAVLFAATRGLRAGRRWGRSPVITWQLFQVVIAITWLQAAVNPFAIVLLVLALGIVVGLLLPSVVEATTRDARTPEA